MVRFQRLVGAAGDVQELEYVSALLQTCLPNTRDNGTVGSLDLQALLSSRYGLKLETTEIITILRKLTGEHGYGKLAKTQAHKQTLQKEQARKETIAKVKEWMKHSIPKKKQKTEKDVEMKNKDKEDDEENQGQSVAKRPTEQVEESPADVMEYEFGDDDDDFVEINGQIPEEYMDVVQLTALLLMPTLAQASHEYQQNLKRQEDDEAVVEQQPEPQQYFATKLKERREKHAMYQRQRHESLRPRPSNLFSQALTMMLQNVAPPTSTSDNVSSSSFYHYPVLDEDLIKNLLLDMGEQERAKDLILIREMVDMAMTDSGKLDVAALVQATTSDIKHLYRKHMPEDDSLAEEQLTTFFYDVFGYNQGDQLDIPKDQNDDNDNKDTNSSRKEEDPVERQVVVSAPDTQAKKTEAGHFDFYCKSVNHTNIDYRIDAHSSIAVVVFIWLFYIGNTLVYASLLRAFVTPNCGDPWAGNLSSFACMLLVSLWTWYVQPSKFGGKNNGASLIADKYFSPTGSSS